MGHLGNALYAPTCFYRNIRNVHDIRNVRSDIRNIRNDIRNTRNIRDYCPEHLLTYILLLCTFLPFFLMQCLNFVTQFI